MTKNNWIKAYSKIMLEWIESQWKIESAHQAGEPYTRMKFEAEASKVEDKLKTLISQVEKDAIEKTNKRWRERITKLSKSYYILGIASTAIDGDADPNSDYNMGYKDGANNKDREWKDKISDLLEDKK